MTASAKRRYFDSKTVAELTAIARSAGTTYENLRLILTHDGSCSPKLALALDQSSGGKLSKKMLRPDIFGASKVA